MELKEKVQVIMERAVENCEVAGVNLLVEQDGKELCYAQAGLADRESHRPMDRDSILRLYSQTKPIAAAAAMILMERGLLDLCQPVSDFLPSYANQDYCLEEGNIGEDAAGGSLKCPAGKEALAAETRQAVQPVRVCDLLNMTSGLVYPDETTMAGKQADTVFKEIDRRLYTDKAMTTREIADALGNCALAFEPGSSWRYGTSADVLGAVVEAVSGMKFGEFLEKERFGPLKMKDTAFWVPEEKQGRLASVYETVRENGRDTLIKYEGNNLGIRIRMDMPPAFESGGAGLASTLDDYMRFAKMLMLGGTLDGVRILQPATVNYLTGGELMGHQQAAFDQWIGLSGFSYGNLMRVCKWPARADYIACQGEYGWDGWLGAYFANFPKEKLTILMGAQKKDAGTFTLTRKLRTAVLTELL